MTDVETADDVLDSIRNDMIGLFDSLGEDLDESNLVERLTIQAPRLRDMESRYTQLKIFGDSQPRREEYVKMLEEQAPKEELLTAAWIQFCAIAADQSIPRMAALMAPIFHIPIICKYLPQEVVDGSNEVVSDKEASGDTEVL